MLLRQGGGTRSQGRTPFATGALGIHLRGATQTGDAAVAPTKNRLGQSTAWKLRSHGDDIREVTARSRFHIEELLVRLELELLG